MTWKLFTSSSRKVLFICPQHFNPSCGPMQRTWRVDCLAQCTIASISKWNTSPVQTVRCRRTVSFSLNVQLRKMYLPLKHANMFQTPFFSSIQMSSADFFLKTVRFTTSGSLAVLLAFALDRCQLPVELASSRAHQNLMVRRVGILADWMAKSHTFTDASGGAAKRLGSLLMECIVVGLQKLFRVKRYVYIWWCPMPEKLNRRTS